MLGTGTKYNEIDKLIELIRLVGLLIAGNMRVKV
jgi:hypothetical protein